MSSKVRGSKLFGAMVIALAEGERLGWVSEVFIDRQTKCIQGIAYRSSAWGTDAQIRIGSGDILKLSRDLVIVSGQAAGTAVTKEMAPYGLRALKGCKITTYAGKHIATLADLVINREDGQILQIVLPENRVLRIDIAEVHFGPDLVMVPAEYESAVAPAEPEPNDFSTRFFSTGGLSHSVREGYEGVKSAVRNNINPEKVKQTLKSGTQTARRTILRTSQAIQQGIEQILKKREAEKKAYKPTAPEPIVPTGATQGDSDTDQPDAIVEMAPESVAEVETVNKSKGD
jgi:sporulation protein YlmC with PRC-barrel domain